MPKFSAENFQFLHLKKIHCIFVGQVFVMNSFEIYLSCLLIIKRYIGSPYGTVWYNNTVDTSFCTYHTYLSYNVISGTHMVPYGTTTLSIPVSVLIMLTYHIALYRVPIWYRMVQQHCRYQFLYLSCLLII